MERIPMPEKPKPNRIIVGFPEGVLALTRVHDDWYRCSDPECGLLHKVHLEITETMPATTELIKKLVGDLPADDKTIGYEII
jgi:hypothetical protein